METERQSSDCDREGDDEERDTEMDRTKRQTDIEKQNILQLPLSAINYSLR